MPSDGGPPVNVTNDLAVDWSPRWSSDGKYLYFASDRGGSMNLWRVGIDEDTGKVSGDPEPLTTPATYLGHIAVSRDGGRIAWVQRTQDIQIYGASFDPVEEK